MLALFNLYKKGDSGFVEKYISVLEAGNTDYPENILGKIGIDLRDPSLLE